MHVFLRRACKIRIFGSEMKRIIGVVLASFGVDPFKFLTLRNFPRYLTERAQFKKQYGRRLFWFPILSDYRDAAGTMSGHYFHQDLLVAQRIFRVNPVRHVDVGSRIDGFVAHVASFREIEVLDIRAVESNSNNIQFSQHDFTTKMVLKTDSLSCLHTIEHFGLGRYGDHIDPEGHLKGFGNLVDSISEGGRLYISFPIGSEERVEFNAHRVFHPESILEWPGAESLLLESFSFVDDAGSLHAESSIDKAVESQLTYGCGIYTFIRLSD